MLALLFFKKANGTGSASNKRINTRCARQGQKHVGSPRFARYYSLRIFARYAGVGMTPFVNPERVLP